MSPLLIPISILASSSVVRDVKDVGRVLGGLRKDQVRPLERKRGLWTVWDTAWAGFWRGREERNARLGLDRVRCNEKSWAGLRGEQEGV